MKSLTRQALLGPVRPVHRNFKKTLTSAFEATGKECDIPKLHFSHFKALCVDVVHIGIAIHTCLLYVHSKIKANYCGRSQSPIFMLCMFLFTYLFSSARPNRINIRYSVWHFQGKPNRMSTWVQPKIKEF